VKEFVKFTEVMTKNESGCFLLKHWNTTNFSQWTSISRFTWVLLHLFQRSDIHPATQSSMSKHLMLTMWKH